VLQRVAVDCSVLAMCHCVLQCVAVRCSVFQCAAVCCEELHYYCKNVVAYCTVNMKSFFFGDEKGVVRSGKKCPGAWQQYAAVIDNSLYKSIRILNSMRQ